MSQPEPIVTLFPRLRDEQVDRLLLFMERDDLLVKGLDRSDKQPYRAGCWPYIGMVAAGVFGFGGQGLGLPRQVAIGFALTAAILASLALIRSFRALRRSRDLLWREEGWHGLAWTQDELCFRSLEHCLLIPWGDLRDLKCFDADEGRFLGDTLWLHLDDKQRVLVAPRTAEGRFAGRTMGEWYLDIKQAWHKATGLHPSSEGGP